MNTLKQKPPKAVIIKENMTISRISKWKRSALLIIRNVQHQKSLKTNGQTVQNISFVNETLKQILNEINKKKQKQFCEQALEKIG